MYCNVSNRVALNEKKKIKNKKRVIYIKADTYFLKKKMISICSLFQVLHETALIEAFNLKAGIEYQLKNCKLTQLMLDLRQLDAYDCQFERLESVI